MMKNNKENNEEVYECYVDYLNKDNNFRQTRKDFVSYEAAVEWIKENFDRFNPDFIKYYF